MKKTLVATLAFGTLGLSACSTTDLNAFAEGMAQAQYNSPYGYNSYGGYGSLYGRSNPYANGNMWVGYNQCRYIGSLYQCDTNGDGYIDMSGDSDDGSFSGSHLRVNGKGEGFTRGENGEWERNRAYDTSRRDDHHHGHSRYDKD